MNGLGGAGALTPASVVAPTPTTVSLRWASALRGVRSAARAPLSISPGTVERSSSASPSSFACPGSGRATHGAGGRDGCSGSGEASNSTVVMSTPEIPSTSAWWVFAITANLSFAMCATNHISHKRLGAVQTLGEDPPRELLELRLVLGMGQPRVADVVAGVEVGVVRPHRPSLREGNERQLLAIPRHEV